MLGDPARHVDGQVAGGVAQKRGHDFGGGQGLAIVQVFDVAGGRQYPIHRTEPGTFAELVCPVHGIVVIEVADAPTTHGDLSLFVHATTAES